MSENRPQLVVVRDFSAKRFEGAVVPLYTMFHANLQNGQGAVISDRTFVHCLIEGPAVLLPVTGVQFDNCDFGEPDGDMRRLLLHPFSPTHVIGAIGVADCQFLGCRFQGVGFTGGEAFLKEMVKVKSRGESEESVLA